jgi:TRAP transporter TAXI family solute receptor
MFKLRFRREDFESYRKELLRVWIPFLLIAVAALLATYFLFVEPPPPSRVVIATGQRTGRYHAFAERYRAILSGSGVALEIRETAGSAENVELLLDRKSGVSVAFVQGGTVPDQAKSRLASLASLYREPLWVFHRGERGYERLSELAGQRLSVGPEGSGTRVVALRLLADSGITADGQAQAGAPILGLPNAEAAEALKAGRIDAAFLIIGPGAAEVHDLIRAEGIRLMSFRQHESYVRRHPYLTSITVSEGLLDLERNIPPEPSTLLAPPAALVANETLHPALIPLLLQAAAAVHEQGSLLDAPGDFPSGRFIEVPLHPEAKRFLKEGPSFLNRFLPFWPASLADRLKFLLLPLLTLLFSIFKIAQPIYNWRIRSRVYRHYGVLRRAEKEIGQELDPARRAETIEALKRLDDKLAELSVPLWSMDEVYQLRMHIRHVRQRLEEEQASETPVGS